MVPAELGRTESPVGLLSAVSPMSQAGVAVSRSRGTLVGVNWLRGVVVVAAVALAGCSAGSEFELSVGSAPSSVASVDSAVPVEESIAPRSPSSSTEPPSPTGSTEPTPTTTAIAVPTSTTTPDVVAPTSTINGDAAVAALAAELSAIEAGIRVAGADAAALDELGRRQQLAYRAVSAHPEWHEQLGTMVDPVAAVPLAFHLAARQAWVDHAANRTPSPPATDLPAWTIVEPLPAEELLGYYREAEALTGVRWQYLAAIHFQETRMGRIVGVSTAGAVGPMQFLPTTWEGCCAGDPTNPRDAIIGAAQYLVDRGAPGDMQAALNGYNPNSGYVGAVTAYAENMIADERAYLGYHGWQVFFTSSEGTVRLPVGYSASEPRSAADYLAESPAQFVP
jgi:hypothetical protein